MSMCVMDINLHGCIINSSYLHFTSQCLYNMLSNVALDAVDEEVIGRVRGNSRLHDLVQAAKFASEGGIAVRSEVPILPNWKEYKNKEEHIQGFMIRLSTISEQNKLNRGKVKSYHATGSRSYVVQLHTYLQDRPQAEPEDADGREQASTNELDAIEAFRVYHTNRNNVISDAAREALDSMEALRAEAVAAGAPPLPNAQVVSKVPSQGGSNSCSGGTFFKNDGILDCSSRPCSRGEDALRSQLAALQEQIEVMKKDNAATRAAFLKMKLDQEEVIQQLSNNPKVSGTIPSPDPCEELLSSQP
ncbi:hypothetical protein HU200_034661 [Digitaria exilis]|uniref:Uncharacterized protein n=1 Tax=Digitaria exilis TaxID=1010633 RepID=A0A835ENM6_9POAL|nr:hypothetical protein HU200_034661 [Digitaria exilis]